MAVILELLIDGYMKITLPTKLVHHIWHMAMIMESDVVPKSNAKIVKHQDATRSLSQKHTVLDSTELF